MSDETGTDGEIAVTGPAGVGVRAKGYRIMDIAWILLGTAILWGAWEMKVHAGDAERQSQAVVKSINDASDKMVKALEKLSDEQKATNAELRQVKHAQRETNCLQDPAMRNRPDARSICKRLSGDDR